MKRIWAAATCLAILGCGGDATNTGTNGGSGNGNGPAKCEQAKKVVAQCYDEFCGASGAATPFCKCWSAGQDISPQTCSCIPLDLDQLCKLFNLDNLDLSNYNCPAASSAVSHFCN